MSSLRTVQHTKASTNARSLPPHQPVQASRPMHVKCISSLTVFCRPRRQSSGSNPMSANRMAGLTSRPSELTIAERVIQADASLMLSAYATRCTTRTSARCSFPLSLDKIQKMFSTSMKKRVNLWRNKPRLGCSCLRLSTRSKRKPLVLYTSGPQWMGPCLRNVQTISHPRCLNYQPTK